MKNLIFSCTLVILSGFSCLCSAAEETQITKRDSVLIDGVERLPQAYKNAEWKKNEPIQMIEGPYSVRDFSSLTESGWWEALQLASIVKNDDLHDLNNKQAMRINFPTGMLGGGAPVSTGYDKFSAKEIYLCFNFSVSSNWQNHSTGTNKMFFITSNGFGGGGDPMFLVYDSDYDPPQIKVHHQGPGLTNWHDLSPNLVEVGIPHGQRAMVELYLKMNTIGVEPPDGEAHLWVNGTKTTQYSNIEWVTSGDAKWDSVRWEPTWGGSGGTVLNEMYQEITRLYFSHSAE